MKTRNKILAFVALSTLVVISSPISTGLIKAERGTLTEKTLLGKGDAPPIIEAIRTFILVFIQWPQAVWNDYKNGNLTLPEAILEILATLIVATIFALLTFALEDFMREK
ncbi:MAG TPA: hypothetical protein ENG74_01330 [Thermoplasmatales archaeon]|nr:hypothetical protein [Thermoplasmatales archaeon]